MAPAGRSRVAPLMRRRLVDDAAQTLREAILGGRFPAGSRLRQEDLAGQLGISRTPIREALVRLGHEGLIDLLPKGGVRVAVLDLEEAVDLYDLREVLDGLAARLAAARAPAASLARLGRELGRMKDCVLRGDANHWFPAHVAFHEEILRAAGNRPLLRQASLVRLSIQRFRRQNGAGEELDPVLLHELLGLAHGRRGIAGVQPMENYMIGGAANAALLNFTKALADEGAPHGILVTGVNPGPIRTERWEGILVRWGAAKGIPPHEAEREILQTVPLKRPGTADEVANLVVFLASELSTYITGTTIAVDGGLTRTIF